VLGDTIVVHELLCGGGAAACVGRGGASAFVTAFGAASASRGAVATLEGAAGADGGGAGTIRAPVDSSGA
jgi:hypothetical protein